MLPIHETIEFSERLNLALKRSLKEPLNAPELATQFNLGHPNEPITAQAAHKWLTGKAKPTSDKIKTLEKWLEVPAYWLKYGNLQQDENKVNTDLRQTTSHAVRVEALTDQEMQLVQQYRLLNQRQQQLIDDTVELFMIERKIFELRFLIPN